MRFTYVDMFIRKNISTSIHFLTDICIHLFLSSFYSHHYFHIYMHRTRPLPGELAGPACKHNGGRRQGPSRMCIHAYVGIGVPCMCVYMYCIYVCTFSNMCCCSACCFVALHVACLDGVSLFHPRYCKHIISAHMQLRGKTVTAKLSRTTIHLLVKTDIS